MKKRPHILIFNPDQWRGDVLGHMGNRGALTPNIDRLVESGEATSFRWAFCQNPLCTPSRCSFMTGWYPHVRGHRSQNHLLRPGEPNLLQILKESGYFVWWGGKNDLISKELGFEAVCDVKYQPAVRPHAMWAMNREKEFRGEPGNPNFYSHYFGQIDPGLEGYYRDGDYANVEGAIDLIRSYDGEKPLCIYLPLHYPHPPYLVEQSWYDRIDPARLPPRFPEPSTWDDRPQILRELRRIQKLGGWSEERWLELRRTYYAMCARVDHQFSLVMNALKDAGIYDDTAIFLFSDHGDYTGDYGLVEKTYNAYQDNLLRVPFIVKPPHGLAGAGGVRDTMVELIDFPATVYDLAGIQPGYTHFGRSLLPCLHSGGGEHRDAVFAEAGRNRNEPHAKDHAAAEFDPNARYFPGVSSYAADSPACTRAVMIRTRRYKYVRHIDETDELYDLQTDPAELVNRINDPKLAPVLAELRERMLDWHIRTADVVPHQIDER